MSWTAELNGHLEMPRKRMDDLLQDLAERYVAERGCGSVLVVKNIMAIGAEAVIKAMEQRIEPIAQEAKKGVAHLE